MFSKVPWMLKEIMFSKVPSMLKEVMYSKVSTKSSYLDKMFTCFYWELAFCTFSKTRWKKTILKLSTY
jgi:hypothetical protein